MQSYVKLNGSRTGKGNFLWGTALTLAWKNLCKQIIQQPIKVQSNNKEVLEIVDNFNRSPCNFGILSQDCYYAKAGFGNKTVHLINEQVKKKFPDKTTEAIKPDLQDESIISYAYFLKKLSFQNPFNKKEVVFNGKSISGFSAKTNQQKAQIRVNQFSDNNNFLIQLKTKAKNDHVFVLKTSKQISPEQVIQKINKTKSTINSMQHDDVFQMPKISLKHKRSINQLIGVFLKNQKFSQYFFGEIYQIINFDLDETGVKVENQGVIKMLKLARPVQMGRKFILDKAFWIVMRQKQQHPYFIANIVDI